MTATGSPTPELTEPGALPKGVIFTNNGDGTAILSGTPAAGTNGTYHFTISAHNGGGSDANQTFILTVDSATVTPSHPQPPTLNVPPLLTHLDGLLDGERQWHGDCRRPAVERGLSVLIDWHLGALEDGTILGIRAVTIRERCCELLPYGRRSILSAKLKPSFRRWPMRRSCSSLLFLRFSSPLRNRSRQRPRSVRLCLEQLEDRVTPTGPTITTLASFGGPEPTGGLVMDSNGNLYGAEVGGAGHNYVYELAKGSSAIKTLASVGNVVEQPVGSLIIDSSGNLYGATTDTFHGGGGFVYELSHGSGTITTLASFPSTAGVSPDAGLVMDSSGNLYGTTSGVFTHGTIFEATKGSGTITTLATFNANNGGGSSGGLTTDSSGNLYGTTISTVFELAKGSSTITTLASFTHDGLSPSPGPVVMDSSGNLYGTTEQGGSVGDGTAFELAKGSSTITTLASFNPALGSFPFIDTRLVMDRSGNLYGTTGNGGGGDGIVFELAKGSSTITTLASFNGTNGRDPDGYPIMDSSGNLYGTTGVGVVGPATIFEIQAVTPGPRLVVMQQSSNSIAGATMSSVTVAIEDQFGNIETSDNSDKITLAIGLGSPKGSLNGSTTLTVSGGEATFSDLSINQVGSGYTLEASTNANGVSSTYSHGFNITPAAPDHLDFLQGPTNTVMGATFTPAVEVAIEDKFNNIETDDDTDLISLTPSSIGSLDGTKSQTVSRGVASFSDLSINQAVNGYSLTASTTSSGVGSLTSSSFNIAPANVTTTAANVTVNFSSNAQSVTLNAIVANASVPNNTVNEGIVTFTVMNGNMTLGSTTGTVSGGNASANFSLPTGQAFGNYTIVVSYSDSQGNFLDNGDTNAILDVVLPPTVTTNPSSQTAAVGGAVTFTAAANAYPPATMQWQLSSDGGKTFSDISGATSTTLTLNNVQASQNGYEYQAVFTNSVGTATTLAAILTVPSAPTVRTPPSNQTVTVGQTATFTVVINGSPTPTVQWQVSTDGGPTWTNLSGATSTTLTLSNVQTFQNGYKYRAVISNRLGTVTTPAGTLAVQLAPIVKINPSSQTVTAYQAATFTAEADGNPTPSVQWQVSTDGGDTFSNINGATSTTLTLNSVTAAMNGYKYQAVFSNISGTATSSVVTLTVNTSSSSPVLNVPPLLALLDSLLGTVETVNANGTETITASLFGILLVESLYDESGNLVGASLFGINLPNWVWFV